jgi:hypothetical protein
VLEAKCLLEHAGFLLAASVHLAQAVSLALPDIEDRPVAVW